MTELEEKSQICAQIVYLKDKATEYSLECVKYMGKEGCTKKYIEALRRYNAIQKEITRLEGLLQEAS